MRAEVTAAAAALGPARDRAVMRDIVGKETKKVHESAEAAAAYT